MLNCNTGETQWVSQFLGGHSHSSTAFDKENNQILVGANSGRFYAFNDDDGSTNWELQLKGQIKGTPMIYNGTAYFGSWDKNYHAVETLTGKIKWSKFMAGRIQTSLTKVPGHDIGVTNTKVGEIIGLDLNNGDILWRLGHGDRNHQFSILVTHNDDKNLPYLDWSRCKQNQLCILNPITGKLVRNFTLPGPFTSVPYAYKDKIFIALDDNHGMVILQ
ncbi:MAG: PQQ-like beta-propeller repeat protein [Bdellovibrionales bacterium]|nr:PQQ-like beta-propeller repeat protein [Bdellovibrionales bacterium]